MVDPNRFHIAYAMRQFADETWTRRAERWTASFYVPAENIGTAEITRVVPGLTPNPVPLWKPTRACSTASPAWSSPRTAP